jgi:hypothetical protein
MLKWLREEPPDWSDVERLEQRIRDIRRRIREAKSAKEPVLPSHGVEFRLQATAKTVEELRLKSLNVRASLGEGPKISKESKVDESEAQRIKAKLMGKPIK